MGLRCQEGCGQSHTESLLRPPKADRATTCKSRYFDETSGVFADCTPTMAWNFYFGDKEAFFTERFAQARAQNSLIEPQDVPRPRPKRAAAMTASDAWIGLSPRKRQRRQ